MRTWINLFEREIISRTEVRDGHSDQLDLVMKFYQNDEEIGYINYSLYRDEVSVQMMEVLPEYRRQGLGHKMLSALQKEYPETEIDMGMQTEAGAGLVASAPSRDIPNGNVSDLLLRKKQIEDKIANLHTMHSELMKHVGEEDFEERRVEFMNHADDWSDLYDELHDVEAEIDNRPATKRIFEGMNDVAVYHGSVDPHKGVHAKMFFTTDPRFAEDYGKNIEKYILDETDFIDSLDGDMIEEFLPLYDPYTDTQIENLSDYMDRSSDTWEIVEDIADDMVGMHGAKGLIVYEGGIKNYLVYDTSAVSKVVD